MSTLKCACRMTIDEYHPHIIRHESLLNTKHNIHCVSSSLRIDAVTGESRAALLDVELHCNYPYSLVSSIPKPLPCRATIRPNHPASIVFGQIHSHA